jgi:hypothetical protein
MLPADIMSNIVHKLDPIVHRATLANLTLVSKSMFAEAVHALYSELVIEGDQLYKLVTNGRAPKYRKSAFTTLKRLQRQGVSRLTTSQHALESIKRLRLLSTPSSATIEAVWAETVLYPPLFPNVQSVIIETSEEFFEQYSGYCYKPDLPKLLAEDGVVLFNEIDICALGGKRSEHIISYLSTLKPLRTLTAHHWDFSNRAGYRRYHHEVGEPVIDIPVRRVFCEPSSYGFDGDGMVVYVQKGEVKSCHRFGEPCVRDVLRHSRARTSLTVCRVWSAVSTLVEPGLTIADIFIGRRGCQSAFTRHSLPG